MFWRFGGYANTPTIDTLLDKPDTTLEELLDDSELLQELKQHNAKLIERLREENVLHRLLRYIVVLDEEDPSTASGSKDVATRSAELNGIGEVEREREMTRLKYAGIACEILSSEARTITDTLMEHQEYLREFWRFLERRCPLNPIGAGYFTKVVESLLEKKTETMLAFIKSMDDVVWHMLRHVDCPFVMDLLLKMISLENTESGQGIIDVRIAPGGRLIVTSEAADGLSKSVATL